VGGAETISWIQMACALALSAPVEPSSCPPSIAPAVEEAFVLEHAAMEDARIAMQSTRCVVDIVRGTSNRRTSSIRALGS
jgi:hypothetical protein